MDPALARQVRIRALERRRKPPHQKKKKAPPPPPSSSTLTAAAPAVPDNPLSPGAVETAARFPFLWAWQAEASAALRQAVDADPQPSAELRQRLRRLLARVVERPHDPQCRTFRRANPAFAALWGTVKAPGAFHPLLWKLGFKEEKGDDGGDDDVVVVSLATEPTAAHLEVMRRLVAMLDDSISSSSSLPPPPQPASDAAPSPSFDEGSLACHVCGDGGLFVDRNTARPDVLFRTSSSRVAVHCGDCGDFVLCGGCYDAGQTGGAAHAGHRFLLVPPEEGWEAVAAEGGGGWGGGGGGIGGWRKSAPVPRNRRPGRGPLG